MNEEQTTRNEFQILGPTSLPTLLLDSKLNVVSATRSSMRPSASPMASATPTATHAILKLDKLKNLLLLIQLLLKSPARKHH